MAILIDTGSNVCSHARAAQRPAARSVAAHHARLVAHADLPHLDAGAELGGQLAHEVPEIDAPLGREVEHQPRAVVELLDARELHREAALADLEEARCGTPRAPSPAAAGGRRSRPRRRRAARARRRPDAGRPVRRTPALKPSTRPNARPVSVSTTTGVPGRSGFRDAPGDGARLRPAAAAQRHEHDDVVRSSVHVSVQHTVIGRRMLK